MLAQYVTVHLTWCHRGGQTANFLTSFEVRELLDWELYSRGALTARCFDPHPFLIWRSWGGGAYPEGFSGNTIDVISLIFLTV